MHMLADQILNGSENAVTKDKRHPGC